MSLLLLQAAQALAAAPPRVGLTLGEAGIIVSIALAIGGLLYRFGQVIADSRNLKTNIDERLQRMDVSLERITHAIEESAQRRVDEAAWKATLEADVAGLDLRVTTLEARG